MLRDDDCRIRLDKVPMKRAESSKMKSCSPKPSVTSLLSPGIPLAPIYYQQAVKLSRTSTSSLKTPCLAHSNPSVLST